MKKKRERNKKNQVLRRLLSLEKQIYPQSKQVCLWEPLNRRSLQL